MPQDQLPQPHSPLTGAPPDLNQLSDREREILILVASGASNKEIAQRLSISTNTVKVHLRNIYDKIGVSSRTEAAMLAVSAGIIPGFVQTTSQSGSTDADTGQQAGDLKPDTQISQAESRQKNRWLAFAFVISLLVIIGLVAYAVWSFEQPQANNPAASEPLTWKTHTAMPTGRFGLAAAVLNDQIYAIGGETENGVTGTVEVYDSATDQWTVAAAKPVPVADVNGAVIDGKIYVPGGRLQNGDLTDVLEVYDSGTDAWSEMAPLPIKLSAYALAVFDGNIYLFGGTGESGLLSNVLKYNPQRDQWTELDSLSSARAAASANVIGRKIYLMGGKGKNGPLDSIEVFSPGSQDGQEELWAVIERMPDKRYGMGSASIFDVIFTAGGQGEKDEQFPLQGFLSSSGEWQVISSLPGDAPWSDMGMVLVGNEIYMIGGKLDGSPSDQVRSMQVVFITILPFVP